MERVRTLTEKIYNLGLLEVEKQDYRRIVSIRKGGGREMNRW